MSDTLELSTRLRTADDPTLIAVCVEREIRASGIKDFFDLAEALLDKASIQTQLSRLDRGTLAAIALLSEARTPMTSQQVTDALAAVHPDDAAPLATEVAAHLHHAAALFLLHPGSQAGTHPDAATVTPYRAVAEQLQSWPAFGLPGLSELASSAPAALEPVPAVDGRFVDRIASERAFASTSEITELLSELEREPARELARGGVALPDAKRLANAMSVDLTSVAKLLAIAADSGLAAREAGAWLITDAGGTWLLDSSGGRWRELARGWLDRLPRDIRSLLGERSHALWGDGFRTFLEWLYPAGGEWINDRIERHTEAAEVLGITANQAPSHPGTLLFSEGPDAAAAAMTALFPSEVEKVYLQHDLSVVAPGPLTPRVDHRLRSLADVESRALASSYRVSTSSLNRALASGETADTVRAFLTEISLTGIPQPLDYLISEAARRYGLLRVGALDGYGEHRAMSYLRSDDDTLITTVLVDQNLSSLGFLRENDRLLSRFPSDTVFWTLSDARYPVAAEDAERRIVSLRRRRHAKPSVAASADPLRDLIERLRLGSAADPDEPEDAWMARQIDTAIRARAALTVRVTMPNGSEIAYQLEPTSIAGGRLRGKDRKSAIERTLPMTSVTGIGPPE